MRLGAFLQCNGNSPSQQHPVGRSAYRVHLCKQENRK